MLTCTRRRLLGPTIHHLGGLLKSLTEHRRSRRTVGKLHGLSDLQLRDIGLRREQFDRRFGP
jgi:uncharacterized protein YjiS (DUF1127 family)